MNFRNQNVLLTLILFLIFPINHLKAQDSDSTHTRISAIYQETLPFVFYNTNEEAGFITKFPLEKLRQEIPENILNDWEIEYNVYTSAENAEISLIEKFETSSLGMYNIIDSMLPSGLIGNNCWHQLKMGAIRFIRNNVFVTVYAKKHMSDEEEAKVEWIARQVDTILIESDKVYDANLIPAPKIQSIEIISDLPEDCYDYVELKINATDPNSQQLTFQQYASIPSLSSKTGDLKIWIFESMKTPEDKTIAKAKIWVWNEDNIVELIEYDIPFKTITDINDYRQQNRQIKVFPNPANETVTIDKQNPETTFAKLLDSTGRLIKTLPIKSGTNTYNISELESGVYFIQIPGEDGVFMKKLIKN